MTLAKAKARANETFIVQSSLTIVTYNRQNIFMVQATEKICKEQRFQLILHKHTFGKLLALLANTITVPKN